MRAVILAAALVLSGCSAPVDLGAACTDAGFQPQTDAHRLCMLQVAQMMQSHRAANISAWQGLNTGAAIQQQGQMRLLYGR